MEFLTFGDVNSQVLLFYHGSCTHWSWYKDSLDELSKKYFLIVPILDGYDKNNKTDFISVEKSVKETTDYLVIKGYKRIHGIYGISLGGAMVIRMLAENRIHVDKAVIDAGIAPYRLPRILTRLILLKDYVGIKLLRTNINMLKLIFRPQRWAKKDSNEDEDYKERFDFIRSLSNKTIINSFYSANNYSMPTNIPTTKTDVRYWYGSRERKARASDMKYVKDTFCHVQFNEKYDMEHGEFITMYPKKCAYEIIDFIN